MPDATFTAVAIGAGALVGASVFVACGGDTRVGAGARVVARNAIDRVLLVRRARARLAADLDRAGWRESPERISVFAIALAACLAVLGATTISALPVGDAAVVCATGILTGLGVPFIALRSAIARRRRRLEGELVPLLELFTLELGGGGSAVSALGSVTMQVQGELAADLRRLLIASQVAGSASFEWRLIDYSERLEIPAIGSLATILAASREYGTGAVQGVRALAIDLRRSQRRELIAHSRRALNHVLLPAAVGVLLPFLAVLMFPAVTALQRNLR
jgi:pilus assembly protein TadC